MCMLSPSSCLLQPDGQVDMMLTRKKRRLNQDYDSLQDRLTAQRAEIVIVDSQYVLLCVFMCVCSC